ncbi:3-deoxy-D-manno-oct-2-ulosonate III transferase WaaZ [Hafnia alvei]|uniref:3-deoxy-D-manno-oct-2-ulosonate III transferase WaaZ n=1 Tax=Hafnia alvei TaxID=569 RepID=UPI001033C40E|nr:3-deoxy-D-manno-oct-2-ulosonate III transferase WaaZ [Hafnia alvei]MDU3155635.1 3-deoxy-D-manno-oct-2-ulosonate III transferase WaaZ [Hafnia alvei]TBL45704.1 3-deoxy-D-manno-oct-2-ulosonate III transferase WaaZ [Hafnia alvei]
MNHPQYISKNDVDMLMKEKMYENAVIFLSGPTSVNTPISLLNKSDVIAVNGSARYLIENEIKPFIYVLTDDRFLLQRNDDFKFFVKNSQHTIVNCDVFEKASLEDKQFLQENCHIMKMLYKREKGGFFKKIKFKILSLRNKNILIDVPMSKRRRLVGFSLDISDGYCSCHTVAYAAIQIAYSLRYTKIICSGLDLVDACSRFYDKNGESSMPSELSRDLGKILPFFQFMKSNVKDIEIYNLSNNTAIDYKIIPYLNMKE